LQRGFISTNSREFGGINRYDLPEKPDYENCEKALILLGLTRSDGAESAAEREQLHLSDGPHHQVLR